jgi:hypothetical protein
MPERRAARYRVAGVNVSGSRHSANASLYLLRILMQAEGKP